MAGYSIGAKPDAQIGAMGTGNLGAGVATRAQSFLPAFNYEQQQREAAVRQQIMDQLSRTANMEYILNQGDLRRQSLTDAGGIINNSDAVGAPGEAIRVATQLSGLEPGMLSQSLTQEGMVQDLRQKGADVTKTAMDAANAGYGAGIFFKDPMNLTPDKIIRGDVVQDPERLAQLEGYVAGMGADPSRIKVEYPFHPGLGNMDTTSLPGNAQETAAAAEGVMRRGNQANGAAQTPQGTDPAQSPPNVQTSPQVQGGGLTNSDANNTGISRDTGINGTNDYGFVGNEAQNAGVRQYVDHIAELITKKGGDPSQLQLDPSTIQRNNDGTIVYQLRYGDEVVTLRIDNEGNVIPLTEQQPETPTQLPGPAVP